MIREESVRFKVRRNGAEFAEIYPADNSAPTLRASDNGEIKMSLQGTFLTAAYNVDGKKVEVDWLNDEIKPVLVLDGVEYSLGILMPATAKYSNANGMETVSIEAYDRCWKIRDTRKETAVYFQAGMLYLDAVEALLVQSGIEMLARTDSSLALTEDREDWEIGTSYLTIANQLLEEINYKEIWFNSFGGAVLEPQYTPTAENIQHIFTDSKTDPRNPKEVGIISVYDGIDRSIDLFNAPNVYICICSNPDKESGMVAVAENTMPMNPLSIVRRGRRIVQIENVSNIASQAELQAYADRKVSESISTGEKIEVKTLLQPGFGVGDITALQSESVTGICVEKSWSMELRPGGTMTHNLEKVAYQIG